MIKIVFLMSQYISSFHISYIIIVQYILDNYIFVVLIITTLRLNEKKPILCKGLPFLNKGIISSLKEVELWLSL